MPRDDLAQLIETDLAQSKLVPVNTILLTAEMIMLSVRENSLNLDDLSMLRVDGDLISPTLRAGDSVVLDHTVRRIRWPGIYVFRIDGRTHVLRAQREAGNKIELIADNPEVAPHTREVAESDLEVMGRAVFHLKSEPF